MTAVSRFRKSKPDGNASIRDAFKRLRRNWNMTDTRVSRNG